MAGMASLTYKGIDTMKWQKDVMRNQYTSAQVAALLDVLITGLHVTHVAISPPMDHSNDYPSPAPAPLTAYAYTQLWADAIHNRGAKVLWRGTWCGLEGIYGFTKLVGGLRISAQAWIDKTVNYINSNPNCFENGDIWACIPEATGHGIFNDSTSFLPHSGAGIQANYSAFFNDLYDASQAAFTAMGKSGVLTGYSAQNYSEIYSGWLPMSLYGHSNVLCFDHYGITHTVAEMESDLRYVRGTTGLPLFHQEWSDYWNQSLAESARVAYLQDMYTMMGRLVDEGITIGFNYWGGWPGAGESIVVQV